MTNRVRSSFVAGLSTLVITGGMVATAAPSGGIARLSVGGATAVRQARSVLDRMSLAQEVGQLIMAGVPAGDPARGSLLITRYHVGEIFLAGRSSLGVVATAAGTRTLRRLATATTFPTAGVGLWIATDQEGGYVQVLNGPGFSQIPTAVAQGALSSSVLRDRSARWARQLTRAGVNVDLAPVTDVVPGNPFDNPPVGYEEREYGRTSAAVERAVRAVVPGYRSAGVAATLKHFPGLGRVTANTDTTADVVDRFANRSAATEAPWRAGIRAGAALVMISLARYLRIDRTQVAAFSPKVITGMLRNDLHFTGVVISDSLGAAAVSNVSPGERALKFVAAGGNVVLSVQDDQVPAMIDAIMARARRYPSFRAKVDESALRVLTRKAEMGLLPS